MQQKGKVSKETMEVLGKHRNLESVVASSQILSTVVSEVRLILWLVTRKQPNKL